jgi:glutathione synthase/RimK-type ligase-like ATP-grasp enzyme
LISRSILFSIEKSGIRVFPNYNTFWHFDDKISQKYIFEALNIPHAPMHVFFDKPSATRWLSSATFPLVFKLRGGAGSSNVFLLRNKNEAYHYLKKMFSKGIKPLRPAFHDFKTKMKNHTNKKDWVETIKRLPVTIKNIILINSEMPWERNYFLVQEFLPGNTFDTRVTIIGNKAFTFRRFNRSNDFKASGSGNIDYTQEKIDKRAILLSFQTAQKLGSQSMAFDIIFNQENKPVILEMSYAYMPEAVYFTGGYWDLSLVFHNEPLWPEEVIIKQVLESTF